LQLVCIAVYELLCALCAYRHNVADWSISSAVTSRFVRT
jgi:hypothetical protein